ncbi:MAG: outer membrane protein transport protein [Gammaproteobacteria bacterium]|nr:outer membrane protein transport protein [Gammaproteobacteria bacterium]
MKTPPVIRKRLPIAIAAAVMAGTSAPSMAAFFQIQENSASGLGNAYAGGAAGAEDASTVWYNPAGMARLSGRQFVVAGHYVDPSIKLENASATHAAALGGSAISGGNGGDAGESALIPNFYFTQSLDGGFVVGLGVNAPYGLATEYDSDWVGRYHAIRSEIKTVNINPGLSYSLNEKVSMGAGLNVQRIDAELTNAVDYGSICAAAGVGACSGTNAADGSARLEGDDTSYGYNLGMLWQFTPDNRVGLAYRSKISHTIEGQSTVNAPNATSAAVAASAPFNISNSALVTNITIPETISLSSFNQLTPQWALMADITRTRWSRLPELRIDFTENNQSDSVITLDLEDVNRYSIGATYSPAGKWSYRFGIALDESPTPNAEVRTARVPDADRTWLALGATYRCRDNASIDIGYVRIMIDDADINKTAASSTSENFFRGNLQGTYESSINIVSVQGRWSF